MDVEPGERVLYAGHPAWWSLLGMHVRGAILALAAGVGAGVGSRLAGRQVQVGWVLVAVLAVVAALAAIGRLRRRRVTYAITSRRLVIERGLVSRELQHVPLERIQDVSCRQSLGQRMLGIGTVRFETAAEAGGALSFGVVDDPRGIVALVDRAQHDRMREPHDMRERHDRMGEPRDMRERHGRRRDSPRQWPTAGV